MSHDALRLCARHGTCLIAVGEDGVRTYTAPPLGPDHSAVARRQANVWADPEARLAIVRRMYAWRMSEVMPHRELEALRGIEGGAHASALSKQSHSNMVWRGKAVAMTVLTPTRPDVPNQAINHAATAVEAAASVAVTGVGRSAAIGLHPRRFRGRVRARYRRPLSGPKLRCPSHLAPCVPTNATRR